MFKVHSPKNQPSSPCLHVHMHIFTDCWLILLFVCRFIRLVYLPLWLNVTKGRAEAEVKALPPRLQERWRRISSRASTLRCDPQASFFPDLIQFFLTVLQSITEGTSCDSFILVLHTITDLLFFLPNIWLLPCVFAKQKNRKKRKKKKFLKRLLTANVSWNG